MSWAAAATSLKSWPCWLWNWNSYLRSCRIPHFSRQKFFRFSDFRTVEWTKWNHACWGPRKLSILNSFLVFPRPVNFAVVEQSSVGMKNSQKLSSKTSSETHLVMFLWEFHQCFPKNFATMFLWKLIDMFQVCFGVLKIFRNYPHELSKSILRLSLKQNWLVCLTLKLPERFHLHLLVIWVVCHVQFDFFHKETSHQHSSLTTHPHLSKP
jgi:hypothetical protein